MTLTLRQALAEDRLPEFVAQQEAAGVRPADGDEFNRRMARLIRAPQPEGQTCRSPARGGSREK